MQCRRCQPPTQPNTPWQVARACVCAVAKRIATKQLHPISHRKAGKFRFAAAIGLLTLRARNGLAVCDDVRLARVDKPGACAGVAEMSRIGSTRCQIRSNRME